MFEELSTARLTLYLDTSAPTPINGWVFRAPRSLPVTLKGV